MIHRLNEWFGRLFRRGESNGGKVEDGDSDTYPSTALLEKGIFPVLEIQWKYVRRYLKAKVGVDSLPYDIIISRIDFSDFEGHPNALQFNPSLRVRHGSRTMLVPANIVQPQGDPGIYFINVKKISLVHIERYFAFNAMTHPTTYILPVLLVSVGYLGMNYCLYGLDFYTEANFWPVLAIAVSLASLSTILWTLVIQHSERTHDAKCRRLENDLLIHHLERSPSSETQPQP